MAAGSLNPLSLIPIGGTKNRNENVRAAFAYDDRYLYLAFEGDSDQVDEGTLKRDSQAKQLMLLVDAQAAEQSYHQFAIDTTGKQVSSGRIMTRLRAILRESRSTAIPGSQSLK